MWRRLALVAEMRVCVSALAWLWRLVIVTGGFVVVAFGSAAVMFLAPSSMGPAALVVFAGLVCVAVTRALAGYARRREFARGYTTLKSFADQYEFRAGKVQPSVGAEPVAPRPVIVAVPGSFASSETAAVAHSGSQAVDGKPRAKRSRVLIALGAAVLVLLVGAARIVVFGFEQPGLVWVPLVAGVALAALLGLGAYLVRFLVGRLALRRVAECDRGDLYLAYSNPELIQTVLRLWRPEQVSARLVLAADERGLRLWAPRAQNGPIAEMSWSAVVSVTVGESAMSMHRGVTRPTVDVLVRTTDGDMRLPIFVRRPELPDGIAPADFVNRAVKAIAARRP